MEYYKIPQYFHNKLRSIIPALCRWDACLSLRNAPGPRAAY